MVILFLKAASVRTRPERRMRSFPFAAFLKTNGGTSIMFEKSRQTAAAVRRLMAAAVIPLAVLAGALILRPAEKDAAALYISPGEPEETAFEVFLIDSEDRLIAKKDGTEYLLPAKKQITVHYQGEEFVQVSERESVAEFLSHLDLQLSPLEMVTVYSPQKAPEIVIGSELVFYEESSSMAEYETVYQYNSEKPEGYEQVVQEGRNGVYEEIYEIIYQDGEEVARQLVDQVETETVDEIVEIGTGKETTYAVPNETAASFVSNGDGTGTITLENGSVVTYSSVRTMRGTAYTKNEGRVGSRTASGTAVRRGVVAVDRNVLPLGTKVYVVSNDGHYDYGVAVAEDTGVRGNTIDLYMDSYNECVQFGVRECTVYILD